MQEQDPKTGEDTDVRMLSEIRMVDGVLEGSGEIHLIPQGPGHSSIGVRINRVNHFKGAVALARMTRAALPPTEFLKKQDRPWPFAVCHASDLSRSGNAITGGCNVS